jgi:hypothetical protein
MHSRTLPILVMSAIGVIFLTVLGLAGLSLTPAAAATPSLVAQTNPYGSCHADPNGLATVPPIGHYETSNSQSKTYNLAFSWLGYSFSSSAGFTTDVSESWVNRNSTLSTYVCGDAEPVQDSHIFWNGPN